VCVCVCVFITAGPSTKLFTWGGGGTLLGAPKLAGTDGLDVRKGEVLVVVQIVEDLVVRGAKGTVVGGFEGSQNDRPSECTWP
jgi:hypothetical protein